MTMTINRKTMGVRSATFVVNVVMLMVAMMTTTSTTTNLQFVHGNNVRVGLRMT